MRVVIKPIPEKYRSIPKKWRPGIPPVFPNCRKSGPTPAEIALARELFGILDEESKDWYRSASPGLFGDIS
jgi:hypothetical protein